jgi:two-component system, LytTR family, sensor kinase
MNKANIHNIIRRKIYLLLLVLNIITSLLRLYYFPGQEWYFHVSLFLLTMLLLVCFWEFVSFESRILEKVLPFGMRPEFRITLQTALTFIIFYGGSSLFFYGFIEPYFNVKTPESLGTMTPVLILLTSIIFNLIYFGTYYFYEWKENLVSKSNLEREQAVVKYDALRNQLNPHFLFNALTSLNSLIFANQQLASDFLQQLSKVYRYILQHKEKETVSLATELDFVNHYIFLLKTRFEDSIDIQVNIEEGELDKGIVPVLTQILIENAVKHNVISIDHPLQITISVENNFLVVSNSVVKKNQVETSNKLGMENLKSLYSYLSKEQIQITESAKQFIVRIPLL